MRTFKTYSKRTKAIPDVYKYDVIPKKLKNQIFHIYNDFIHQKCFLESLKDQVFEEIYKVLCKETGVKRLYYSKVFGNLTQAQQIERYFDEIIDVDEILDTIEVIFFYMRILEEVSTNHNHFIKILYTANDAIKELNERFIENEIGFEYISEKIVKIDNTVIHRDAIQPVLKLLISEKYSNINEEYLRAHDHFRHKRYPECLNECLKAFESTMKILSELNGWKAKETDTAKSLINLLFTNNFFPKYKENSLNALKQLLESSIPTVRNKNSGHGQGSVKKIINIELAKYMLNITGSTILYMVENQEKYQSGKKHNR